MIDQYLVVYKEYEESEYLRVSKKPEDPWVVTGFDGAAEFLNPVYVDGPVILGYLMTRENLRFWGIITNSNKYILEALDVDLNPVGEKFMCTSLMEVFITAKNAEME